MTISLADPPQDLADGLAELIEAHGDDAVGQFVTDAYADEIAKAAPEPDPTDLEERVNVLEKIVARLAADPASLAKAAGPGELSDQDKRAVASMAAGF
ncbi:MAG: hypothetical protein ACR2IP_07190 [Solirubrobacteraceae bacterium]